MSFTVIAYEVKPAPKEKFTSRSNIIEGWELAKIIEKYSSCGEDNSTIWNVGAIYEGLCEDLEDEERGEELLKELEDGDITLDDLYRIRDFLKVCAENDYILGSWY